MRRLLATLALALLLGGAGAVAAGAANQAWLDSTVRFLQGAQNPDGGFGGDAGAESNQLFGAWAALALAAAGINPQDQRKPGGADVFSYLQGHYRQAVEEGECRPDTCATLLDRELMVVNAACADPHDFGGADLAAELEARAAADGSFPHAPGGRPGVNDTIFAIFALAPIQEPGAQASIQPAADWVEAKQLPPGGWAWSAESSRDEVDMTGAAVQALVAAGRGGGGVARKGVAYLHAAQNPDGGFPEVPGDPESNAASTAWAVQAIWAMGENPESWRTGSGQATEEPLDYLASLQEPDGHIRWKRSRDMNGIWMTAYTAPAFAGRYWPFGCVPRSVPPPATSTPAGVGGGDRSGAGAVAGGGGRGAPLFSRPRPQSRGRTPGGARKLGDAGPRPRDRSRTRRGENRVQPTAAETVEAQAGEPPAASEETTAAGVPGPGSGGGDNGSAAARGLAAGSGGSGAGAGEVSGVLVGSGKPAFGAPGLHGSGAGESPGAAAAIGLAVLLAGLAGAWFERRRPGSLREVAA
jgi:prenyltransferase beta subunit